jgi:hypothetical protein
VSDLEKIKGAVSEEVLQQVPAGVIVVDAPSGKIIFRNRRAQRWREQSLSQASLKMLVASKYFALMDDLMRSKSGH